MSYGLVKYVITGDIIEKYTYKNYIHGTGGANRTSAKSLDLENSLKNYANTNQRRRDKVRRLACSNFSTKYDKFFTLTFAENMVNVKECNYLFLKFIKRLKYKYNKNLKYLAVIEFQNRGAVHYHVLSDIPYIPQAELQELWGHGFVFINAITHVDNIGAYIVKYMEKNTNDLRLQGLKGYLFSRNLKKPNVSVNHDLKDFDKWEKNLIKKYNLNNINPVYKSNYDTEMLGHCEYIQYNLKRRS